jgi:flagellin
MAGESFTLNGLKFNATATVTPSQLAAVFSNLTAGMTAAAATTLHSTDIANLGTYDSATKFNTGSFTTGAVVNSSKVVATSTGSGDVTEITQSATLTGTRQSATVASSRAFVAATTTPVADAITQQNKVTFKDIREGETVTVAGLAFTANTTVSGADLAGIFQAKMASSSANSTKGSFNATTLDKAWKLPTDGKASGADLVIEATNINALTSTETLLAKTTVSPAVFSIEKTDGTGVIASTVYGTVTFNSNSAFTIRPGANAYPSASGAAKDASFTNFTKLGFNADTINAKSIGRLSFQVGPSPDQLIHIDLADFGQNGEITGAITSSTAPTNILTVQAANDVTQSVNKSLDMIAQTRASMGAVMNRLEHVIDNLTNVVMNSEASRSQIEDADYAKASTELARTQIMQQAATAVLAQANTSQQTVLKLLQG